MKRIFIAMTLLLLITTSAFGFLGLFKGKVNEKTMNPLASHLTKLAKQVESTVRYKKPPKNISDQQLLRLSTQKDPKLLKKFDKYKLRVSQKNGHAVVLVCDKKGKRGLLEDSGCTSKMDKHLWKNKKCPCQFTISPKDVCKK